MKSDKIISKLKKSIGLVFTATAFGAVCMMLMGLDFLNDSLVLDVNKNPLYKSAEAKTILDKYDKSLSDAKSKYNGVRIAVHGRIGSKKADGKEIGIVSLEDRSGSSKIIGKASGRAAISRIASLKEGDEVIVYGKISFGLIDQIDKNIYISIDSIYSIDEVKSLPEGTDSFSDGYIVRETMVSKTIANGKVMYFMPLSWEKKGTSIKKEGLGTVEGYRYVLDNPKADGENCDNLFICYFDSKLLKNEDDITDTIGVEKAIISNILGDEVDMGSLLMNTVTAQDGSGVKYQYYKGTYDSDLFTAPYRVEMVFRKAGEDGILFYLYLYDNDVDMAKNDNVKDILYVMNLTRVN